MMSSFPDSFFQAQKKIWERTAQQWKEICINLLKIYSIHPQPHGFAFLFWNGKNNTSLFSHSSILTQQLFSRKILKEIHLEQKRNKNVDQSKMHYSVREIQSIIQCFCTKCSVPALSMDTIFFERMLHEEKTQSLFLVNQVTSPIYFAFKRDLICHSIDWYHVFFAKSFLW